MTLQCLNYPEICYLCLIHRCCTIPSVSSASIWLYQWHLQVATCCMWHLNWPHRGAVKPLKGYTHTLPSSPLTHTQIQPWQLSCLCSSVTRSAQGCKYMLMHEAASPKKVCACEQQEPEGHDCCVPCRLRLSHSICCVCAHLLLRNSVYLSLCLTPFQFAAVDFKSDVCVW